MWKPRSTLVSSEGGKSKSALAMVRLRSIGAKQWHRRHVFIEQHYLYYGKETGSRAKQIPFELLQLVRREETELMRAKHAPVQFAAFGWYLAIRGRTIYFCAEDAVTADAWVDYLTKLLQMMRGGATGSPLQAPQTSSLAVAAATTASSLPALTMGETGNVGPRGKQSTPQLEHVGPRAAGLNAEEDMGRSKELPPGDASWVVDRDSAVPRMTAVAITDDAISDDGVNAGEEETAPLPLPLVHHSASQSIRSGNSSFAPSLSTAHVASDAGDDHVENDDGMDASSEDTEGGDVGGGQSGDSDPEEAEEAAAGAVGAAGITAALQREQQYVHQLLAIAETPYSHLAYRIPALASNFRSGDDAGSVVFSRAVEKVGKHDNPQPRELVMTTRHLYLFSKPRLGGGTQVRCIDLKDITGVVESTTDDALLAVLVPNFHDILLKMVPQNSCIAATPVEPSTYFPSTPHTLLFYKRKKKERK